MRAARGGAVIRTIYIYIYTYVTGTAVAPLTDATAIDAGAVRPAAVLVGAAGHIRGAGGPAPLFLAHAVAADAQAVRPTVGTARGRGTGRARPARPTRTLAVAALAAARAAERARGDVAVDRLPPLFALAHVIHARAAARAVVRALPLGAALTGPQVIAVADARLAARAVAAAVVRTDAYIARRSAVVRVALALDSLRADLADAVAMNAWTARRELTVRPTPAREAEAGQRAVTCGADCAVAAADRVVGQGHRQQRQWKRHPFRKNDSLPFSPSLESAKRCAPPAAWALVEDLKNVSKG